MFSSFQPSMSSSRRRITRIGGGQPKPSSMTLRRPGDEQDQQSEIGKDDPLPSPASQDPTPGQGRASGSSSTPRRRKLTIPNCAVCDTPPKEPHGVYCCGAMYCHTCFVRAMSEAAIAGRQAACASCGKPMGDPPKKRRLLTPAAQATLAPASVLPGPPIPGWSFATAAEINSNPFRHMSKPEDWIPSTRAEPSGIQHPSLPSSGPNSMSSMYHSFDNYPMRGHELMHLQATNPSKGSDLPLPNIYRPGGRMTEASGRNAQNQRIMAVIGDVDEMLPKLPDIFAAEEARRIEQQKEAELKVKQELPRPQVVKGPGW